LNSGVTRVVCSAGAMLRSAGGDYTYLQRAFGDQVAYSWVFMSFTIQRPASLSIVGVIAGHYASALLNGGDSVSVTAETPTHIRWLATAYVGLLTLVNLLPIALMSRVNAAMALSKPLLVLALIALGVAFALQDPAMLRENFTSPWASRGYDDAAGGSATAESSSSADLTRLGPATFAALFTYNGWSSCAVMAEEMRRYEKRLLGPFDTKNDHFAKTGSGQTEGNAEKKVACCSGPPSSRALSSAGWGLSS
jgi:APA family basic amino acid/polyamine antiporter